MVTRKYHKYLSKLG